MIKPKARVQRLLDLFQIHGTLTMDQIMFDLDLKTRRQGEGVIDSARALGAEIERTGPATWTLVPPYLPKRPDGDAL